MFVHENPLDILKGCIKRPKHRPQALVGAGFIEWTLVEHSALGKHHEFITEHDS